MNRNKIKLILLCQTIVDNKGGNSTELHREDQVRGLGTGSHRRAVGMGQVAQSSDHNLNLPKYKKRLDSAFRHMA